jgi:hypothetical protein
VTARQKHRARPPCRLYFLLAREAPLGVIFRRGPSRWTRLVRWNVADDAFEMGQWFKGRVYEKRADLSPDGTKLVYFAQKINRQTLNDPSYTYAWTAISRPPFFTALALWPKGDCWNGGGLFETNTRVLLNHSQTTIAHGDHQPQGLEVTLSPDGLGEDATVLNRRVVRDGWRVVQPWQGRFIESPFGLAHREMMTRGLSVEAMMAESFTRGLHELSTDSGYLTDAPEIHEKVHPSGAPTLVMRMYLERFVRRYTFEFRGATCPALRHVEWADWDHRGRLAMVRKGQLLVGDRGERGDWTVRCLVDLNDQVPTEMSAPAWAREW